MQIFLYKKNQKIRQLSKKLPSPEEKFMSNYNYSKIDKILQNNCVENIKNISKYDVKNILLIGGTGYLGAHIISTFLKNETGIVYCLIRQKNNESPLYRINRRLEFYFAKDFLNKYSNRIKVIKGDITSKNLGLTDLRSLTLRIAASALPLEASMPT